MCREKIRSRKRSYIAILSALLMLTGCASSTVRSPICEPPPLPASWDLPCRVPDQLADVPLPMGDLFLLQLEAYGGWKECVRKHQHLVEMVKARDKVCAHVQSQLQSQSKPWWKFE